MRGCQIDVENLEVSDIGAKLLGEVSDLRTGVLVL